MLISKTHPSSWSDDQATVAYSERYCQISTALTKLVLLRHVTIFVMPDDRVVTEYVYVGRQKTSAGCMKPAGRWLRNPWASDHELWMSRNGHDIFKGATEFEWRSWGKPLETSVRISCNPVEFQTGCFANIIELLMGFTNMLIMMAGIYRLMMVLIVMWMIMIVILMMSSNWCHNTACFLYGRETVFHIKGRA
jgi:hypothetical protein